LRLLKDNQCFDQYVRNVAYSQKCGTDELQFTDYMQYLTTIPPQDFLFKPFLWRATKQGDDFWRNLNKQWCSQHNYPIR